MTVRRSGLRVASWGLLALVLLLVQYLTISNTVPIAVMSDASTFRGAWSVFPLRGTAARAVGYASHVVLQPFRPIIWHATVTFGSRWTGPVVKFLFPFRSMVANHLWFSLVNSVVWLACIAGIVRLFRYARIRRRGWET
jgi:uncharacterized membrane protein YjfL (UPF0719 family)